MDDFFLEQLKAQDDLALSIAAKDATAAKALLDGLFLEQRQVVLDPYPFKSVLCPRRVGKTHMAASYALYVALIIPGATIALGTTTLKRAKKLYFKEILRLGKLLGVNLKSHRTDGTFKLDNGSEINLFGAETLAEADKMKGWDINLAIVDESASFSEYIFDFLVDEVLDPATAGCGGSILIMGTPGKVLSGEFYQATHEGYLDDDGHPTSKSFENPDKYWDDKGNTPKWSFHRWDQSKNIYTPGLWARALLKKARNKWPDNHPIWVSEYLGLWISLGDAMVYAYSQVCLEDRDAKVPIRCHWKRGIGDGFNDHGLELGHDWRYAICVDPGWADSTAIIVAAYASTSRNLYIVYQWKKQHQHFSDIAAKVLSLEGEFGEFDAWVIDSAGKQAVESMEKDYDLEFTAAIKTNKYDQIQILNSDFWTGQILMEAESELSEELLHLQWDLRAETRKALEKRGKLQEDQNAENHLCDTLLYVHRHCHHHEFIGGEMEVEELSPDEARERARKRNLALQAAKAREDGPFVTGSMEVPGGFGDE